ncbi:MAG: restriction endonuclease subunit S [Opitutales bacterium]|nr:restriction endonuclease subunit S [Opitutales bacterium]
MEWRALGEVCVSLKKETLKQHEVSAERNERYPYPVVNSSREFYGYYGHYNNEGNAFCIAARGNAGFVSFIAEPFWAGGLCYPYRSRSDNELLTKFVFYYLKTQEQHMMDTFVAHGSITAINKTDVDGIPIPLPPLPIQEEIVRILDTFTELTQELTQRRAQFAYYRDKLLTFGGNAHG